MKLLIVDDEELTRTGVISSIDWQSIGIQEVLQADDGINGIEMARVHRPDIVLCDVRMPRLDGIAMLEQLEEILPDIVPVFMSGYSDKEYLKAAIKLKAVNYIEKPLNPVEIRDAIMEARDLCLEKKRTRQNASIHSMESASRLALLLTQPFAHAKESIDQLIAELSLSISNTTPFTAIVLKTDTEEELPLSEANAMFLSVREFLKTFHIDCIFAEKRVQYMVYFLFGSTPGAAVRKSIEEFFCNLYSRCTRFCIAAGLLQVFPELISPILLLLFPCRAASFSPQVPFCLLFIRHLFPKQPQSFLPVRRMNFSLFSLKKIRKKQKLSLIICFCIITRIRIFCLIRPRISITNYSVLWTMLRVS